MKSPVHVHRLCTQFASFSDASEFFTGGRMFVKTGQKLFVRVDDNPRGARICKRLWSPGTDSEESISPAYVAWRASTTNRVIVRQAGNRFLGSLKGLQIPERVCTVLLFGAEIQPKHLVFCHLGFLPGFSLVFCFLPHPMHSQF